MIFSQPDPVDEKYLKHNELKVSFFMEEGEPYFTIHTRGQRISVTQSSEIKSILDGFVLAAHTYKHKYSKDQ
jgi:glycerol-3-phosphate responsive antiterminator